MVATFARDQRKLVKLFLFTFVGSAITVFLQFILYISQNVPFVSKYLGHVANQGTLVGSWVDFAYFVTFVFVLALLMYEVLIPKGFFKILSFITMLVSLLALVFLNFKTAWIVALVSSLVVFVYKSSVERSLSSRIPKLITEEQGEDEVVEKQKFPIMSMVSLLVGLFFLLSNTSIGSSISQSVGISFNDIRPSFTTTTQVMRSSIFHDPLFGAGAGLYSDVWNLHYPTIINSTLFWSSPFESGFNVLESLISTNGLLPVIALIFVLIFSLIHGFKLFNCQFPDRFTRFMVREKNSPYLYL
jgi:membrane protein implicated in regulation of membrane protease activity